MSERQLATKSKPGAVEHKRSAPAPKPAPADDDHARIAADTTIKLAQRILSGDPTVEAALVYAPSAYIGALWALFGATTVKGEPTTQLAELDKAAAGLRPAIEIDAGSDDEWVARYYTAPIADRRSQLERDIARAKIDNAIVLGNGKAVALPPDSDARAQAAILRPIIKQTESDLKAIGDRGLGMAGKAVEHEAVEMYRTGKSEVPTGLGGIQDAVTQLDTIDGLLALTDDELAERLANDHGVWNNVRNYSELVKAGIQVTKGGLLLGGRIAAGIAMQLGHLEWGTKLLGGVRALEGSHLIGGVISGIELVHGIAEVFTGKTTFDKINGGVDAVEGALGVLDAFEVDAAGPAGFVLMVTWKEFTWFLGGVAETGTAITTGWMSHAVERIATDGAAIADAGDLLARTTAALVVEKDPQQQKTMATMQTANAKRLGQLVDGVVDYFSDTTSGFDIADPNHYRILREAFAPVMDQRGHYGVADAPRAAVAMLDRIRFVIQHADALAEAGTLGRHVSDVAAADQPDADDD